MPLFDKMDVELKDADVVAMSGSPIPGANTYIVDRDVYEVRTYPGTTISTKFLLFRKGQSITQVQYDRALVSATDDAPVVEP